jgi:putative DNA primase/helicase
VTEWIESVGWDGTPRLDAFYDTVQEDTEKCSAKMKRIVMMRWAVSAIAAAFSPNGIMARGVLVFQGVQYSGKTRWIDALAPKGMELIKTG